MARLEEVLTQAVNLKLTNGKAVGITRENVESGRQTAAQYIAIWEKRVQDAELYEGKPEIETEWIPDGCSQVCMQCAVGFWLLKRRHHCRGCGWLLCNDCSSYRQPLDTIITPTFSSEPGEPGKKYRVCNECRTFGVDMKRTMDILNQGGKISTEQAEQIWERYDEDQSGTLSKAELTHVMTDCLKDQKATLQRAAAAATAEAKSEVDKLISDPKLKEGSAIMSPAVEHLAGFAAGLAKGLVSQCLAQVDAQLADPSPLVDKTFARMDSNDDGVITKDEFVALIGEVLAPPGLADACDAFDESSHAIRRWRVFDTI